MSRILIIWFALIVAMLLGGTLVYTIPKWYTYESDITVTEIDYATMVEMRQNIDKWMKEVDTKERSN